MPLAPASYKQSVRVTEALAQNHPKISKVMSKEYYKKAILTCKANMAREREQKKKDNARIADSIKKASSAVVKAQLRRDKKAVSDRHDYNINRYKQQLEGYQKSLKNCK